LIFKLKEGKNREIRNICNFFNLKIVKLIRIEYGPIKLSNLNIGQLEEIKDLKKLC
jgi:16S rRNA uridine-516 pseudouridylate synthase and related pseudouridylate synthases